MRHDDRHHSVVLLAVSLILMQSANAATVIGDGPWYFDYLNIVDVHRAVRGEGILVAVVDSGVDGNHRSLRGRVAYGFDLTVGGPLAGDDVHGWTDRDGHGTAMSGIIAAHGQVTG